MPQLTLQGTERQQTFSLADSPVLTIGRSGSNDIVLPDAGRRVSRFHAAVIRIPGVRPRYFLRDLSSSNGTRVFGRLVHQHLLNDNDVVAIADYRLTYSEIGATRPARRLCFVANAAGRSDDTKEGTQRSLLAGVCLNPARSQAVEELLQRSAGITDLRRLLSELIGAVVELVGADCGIAGLLQSGDSEGYEDVASAGMGPSDSIRVSGCDCFPRLYDGQVVREDEGPDGSTLLVPVVIKDEVRAFLCVSRRSRLPFSEEDVDFLFALGRLAPAHLNVAPASEEVLEWPMEFVGAGRWMERLLRDIQEAASTDLNVLVTGETGSGKELVAKAIHAASPHSAGPTVARSCAVITESLAETEIFGHAPGSGIFGADLRGAAGWFELANGGTLLLDEIQSLTLPLQDKFLRVLQDKQIVRVGGRAPVFARVKIIAATDQDLDAAVEQGRFRAALYQRFGKRIAVPPLRERGEQDRILLIHFFLDRYAVRHGTPARALSRRALQILIDHDWPGNVRELESSLRAAAAKNHEVLLSWDFDARVPRPQRAAAPGVAASATWPTVAETERDQIIEALEVTGANKTRAQKLLGYKSRQTLLNKMDSYGIPRNYGERTQ